jgi:branched-subunit amino acid transport protein
MNGQTDLWTLAVIVGLAGVTVLTRCFFFILGWLGPAPSRPRPALHYAPVAALAGVVAPEVVMQQGHLIASWQDARVFAAAAGAAAYFWRDSVLLTIVAGMAVYLPLHLALGW